MKRSITKRDVGQWSLLTVLTLWGMLAFLVLAGEDNPEAPISLTEFFLWKLAALINFGAAVLVGKWCDKHGWLPDLEKHFGREQYGN